MTLHLTRQRPRVAHWTDMVGACGELEMQFESGTRQRTTLSGLGVSFDVSVDDVNLTITSSLGELDPLFRIFIQSSCEPEARCNSCHRAGKSEVGDQHMDRAFARGAGA